MRKRDKVFGKKYLLPFSFVEKGIYFNCFEVQEKIQNLLIRLFKTYKR